ncbi:MAG: Ig-like domain-containing protein [Deltaproteobacteria bacterium]|nr:Ig-like domain-containing protein [Deltaproteobacteria bacterium]
MKHIKLLCLGLIFMLAACGGSSTTSSSSSDGSGTDTADTTAPTVSSVTTDNGGADTALSSTAGDDRVSGLANATDFFTITFSEAMDPATVIADNITLTCNEAAVTISTPATSDNIIWTVPVESDLPGYSPCELSLGTGLKDAAGNALAEAATYLVSTQCATDDDFTVDTLGFIESVAEIQTGSCWMYKKISDFADLPVFFTVSDDGSMFYSPSTNDAATGGGGPYIYKSFEASAFTASLVVPANSSPYTCGLIAVATDQPITNNSIVNNSLIVKAAGGACKLQQNVNTTAAEAACNPASHVFAGEPLYLQLAWDGTTATAGYKFAEEDDYASIGSTPADLTDSYVIGIYCESDSTADIGYIDSFTVDAVATGPGTQY